MYMYIESSYGDLWYKWRFCAVQSHALHVASKTVCKGTIQGGLDANLSEDPS